MTATDVPGKAGETAKKPKQQASPVSTSDGDLVSTIRNLWPYMWPSSRPELKRRVWWAFVALVVAKIVTVFVPFLYKYATDALAGNTGELAFLPPFLLAPVMLVIAYGGGRVLMIGFTQLRDGLFARVSQHAVRSLARKTFMHIHDLSLRFHLQRRTGGLSRIIERGTKGIETVVRFTILSSFPTALEFIFMAGIVGYNFDWTYLAVIVGMIVFYIVFTIKASNWRIAIRRQMNDSDTDANSKAVDSLLNYETVKYFGNENVEADRFDRSMQGYEQAAIKTSTSLSWLNFGQTLIFSAGLVICMAMSARAVMAGTQTLGDFVLINALLMQLYLPLNFIGSIYREIKQGFVDIEAMFNLLDVPAEVEDKPGAEDIAIKDATIRFENVRFHYDETRAILKGIDFEVPAGRTVAIVGPSGAGKSTISRLLFRFYDVTGGRITIDGQDIRDVTQASVRHSIGMVPQDTVLFNESIAYNIRYGRPDATADEVRQAADMAQISNFIKSLPDGFDTEVGERGLKLSGGEKQRVAIARTILKAPPILILDEATSALDSHTEQEIQSALDQVSKGRTTLVIAHRLSTVVGANEIIVLDAGTIAERGTHQELLSKNGIYASMWNRQREVDEAAERLRKARESDDRGYIASLAAT
uniref:ABCB family ABC transporter ATP-binding protein/permease n=1 Tax=Pararhizobium sp. IMCC3301 TaxID=3067904 RepID=UPI0035319B2B